MAWIHLLVAGLLEVVWASLLGETRGFREPLPTVGFVAALVASMYLLSLATRSIPIGTAYAIWVGIGAVGAFLVGLAVRDESTNPAQLAAMLALVGSLVAVKVTSGH
jgi:quaternary ammonium compound-resistance protein SugE